MNPLSLTPRVEFIRGIRESGPLLIGLLPFALILGMQGGQKGMSWLEMLLMTGMNFAGGSEFAAVNAWVHPLPIALIAGMTLMINSRHILMGAALAPYLRHLPMKKILPALFFMCDESWAMGMAEARKRRALGLSAAFNLPYYAGVCFILYTTWISFAACGAALGPKLGDVAAWGFGMAFPAVFLVLIRGMWRGVRPALPWLVSLIVAAVVYRVFGGAWYVPAGAAAGLATAWLMDAEAEAA
nr:AzlC family ABC transporter permease [Cardiobacterium valvarum]